MNPRKTQTHRFSRFFQWAAVLVLGGILAACGADDSKKAGEGPPVFGFKTSTLIMDWSTAYSVARDGQGRFVVSGSSYDEDSGATVFALARYTAQGELDASFGSGGVVTTPVGSGGEAYANSVTLDGQGRIVVAGNGYDNGDYVFALARYTAAGELDSSFGALTAAPDDGDLRTGIVSTPFGSGGDDFFLSVVIDKQNRIVAAGGSYDANKYNFVLARYTTQGELDASFGDGNGILIAPLNSNEATGVALDSQGRIVAVGTSLDVSTDRQVFTAVRYTAEGELDVNFGDGDGIVTTPIGASNNKVGGVAVDNQNRVVVAGSSRNSIYSTYDFTLVRYTAAGELDTSFGELTEAPDDGDLRTGIVTTPIGVGNEEANAVVLDKQGRIIVAGTSRNSSNNSDFALARYTTQGELDTSFGDLTEAPDDGDLRTGTVMTPIGTGHEIAYGVVVDGLGRIVAAGYSGNNGTSEFALVAYKPDGSLD